MSTRALPVAWVAVALTLAAFACSDPTRANGTALFISADVRGVPRTHQLRLIGREDTTTLFGPVTLPGAGDGGSYDGGLLTGMATVRILLGDTWNGHVVTVHGEALDGAAIAGRGDSAPITVTRGVEEDVVLVLAPPGVDGGVCADCPGCCAGGTCQTAALDHCGGGGAACVACDRATSDTCNAGACGCGAGADCGIGAVCLSGQCQCGPLTCKTGCCQDNRCVGGLTDVACGSGGNVCAVCSGKQRCDVKQSRCH